MTKVVDLHQHRSAKERLVLARQIRRFEGELVEAAVGILLSEGDLDLAADHDELREALMETPLGQAVAALASHAERVAWTLEHTKSSVSD